MGDLFQQVQDLPWATLDDLIDARKDVAAYGRCWAEIVSVEGDLRLKRVEALGLRSMIRKVGS